MTLTNKGNIVRKMIWTVQFEVPLGDLGEKNKAGNEVTGQVWRYTSGNHLDITEIRGVDGGAREECLMAEGHGLNSGAFKTSAGWRRGCRLRRRCQRGREKTRNVTEIQRN